VVVVEVVVLMDDALSLSLLALATSRKPATCLLAGAVLCVLCCAALPGWPANSYAPLVKRLNRARPLQLLFALARLLAHQARHLCGLLAGLCCWLLAFTIVEERCRANVACCCSAAAAAAAMHILLTSLVHLHPSLSVQQHIAPGIHSHTSHTPLSCTPTGARHPVWSSLVDRLYGHPPPCAHHSSNFYHLTHYNPPGQLSRTVSSGLLVVLLGRSGCKRFVVVFFSHVGLFVWSNPPTCMRHGSPLRHDTYPRARGLLCGAQGSRLHHSPRQCPPSPPAAVL